ncbi:MAG TPA: DUF3658 domain-containing protein [Terriglobales bacterium]|jgi:hypothetical protein|nr:DUF3658 domain-containing protein [Terriglobales bacterium]
MRASSIDEAILSATEERWTKVAMVIARVADSVSRRELPPGDEGFEAIAGRIAVLVRDGHLEVQGDLRNWRFSEVRRAEKAN